MSDKINGMYPICFAGIGSDDRSWHPLLITGNWQKDGQSWPVTKKDLENHVALFKSGELGPKLPITLGHSGDPAAAAVGWIHDFRLEGEQLHGQTSWVGDTKKKIKAGKWAFFSPEFYLDWENAEGKSKGFALMAAALLNRQHLKKLPEVAVNFAAFGETKTEEVSTMNLEQALAEIEKLKGLLEGVNTDKATFDESIKTKEKAIGDQRAEIVKLSEKIKTFEGGDNEMKGQLITMGETVKKLTDDLNSSKDRELNRDAWARLDAQVGKKCLPAEAYGEKASREGALKAKFENRTPLFKQAHKDPALFDEMMDLRPDLPKPQTKGSPHTQPGDGGEDVSKKDFDDVDRETATVKMAEEAQASGKFDSQSYAQLISMADKAVEKGQKTLVKN